MEPAPIEISSSTPYPFVVRARQWSTLVRIVPGYYCMPDAVEQARVNNRYVDVRSSSKWSSKCVRTQTKTGFGAPNYYDIIVLDAETRSQMGAEIIVGTRIGSEGMDVAGKEMISNNVSV